jgi:hypothetical protein
MRDACVACIRHRKHRDPLRRKKTLARRDGTDAIDASVDACRCGVRLNDRMRIGRRTPMKLSDSSKERNRSGHLFRRQRQCSVDVSWSQAKLPLDTSSGNAVCKCVRSRTYGGSALKQKIKVVIEVSSFSKQRLDKRGTLKAQPKHGRKRFRLTCKEIWRRVHDSLKGADPQRKGLVARQPVFEHLSSSQDRALPEDAPSDDIQ